MQDLHNKKESGIIRMKNPNAETDDPPVTQGHHLRKVVTNLELEFLESIVGILATSNTGMVCQIGLDEMCELRVDVQRCRYLKWHLWDFTISVVLSRFPGLAGH
jgi:hypothetical protein